MIYRIHIGGNKMDKKFIAILVIVVVAAIIFFSYFTFMQNDDDVITIGALAADYDPALVVANKTRTFDAHGLKTNVVLYNDDRELITAISNGSIDVAYMDIVHVISYVDKGAHVKIISAAQNGGSGLVVSNKSGISSVHDLVGKNVATPSENSIQYLLLENYLNENGISINDVNVSSESCSYMNESIKKGKIDAAITYEPYVDINMINGSKLLLNSDTLMPDHPNIVMIASDEFISNHPDETKEIVKIHENITNNINNNSGLYMGMVPLDSVLNPVLKQQYVSNVSLISGLSDDYIQNVNNFMNIEIELGRLKQPIPQEKLFWLHN